MAETVAELTQAKEVAEHIYRMLATKMQIPEFGIGGVPVEMAAKVLGKDMTWVRQGIIDGWLPIGKATLLEGNKRYNFYISPKLLWELTGYVWTGETV